MKISRAIHIISTGGTIDSAYQGSIDTVVPNRRSAMPEYLRNLRLDRRLRFSTVCMKDSRDLTPTDRQKLVDLCLNSPYRKILITHGTYTMAETAKFLQKNLADTDKVVVITGSLTPLVGFTPSDGLFNLGYGVGRVDDLPNGVYICFNSTTYRSARFDEFARLVNTDLKSRFTT